jgi:DNA excision repair protein ERCC-4
MNFESLRIIVDDREKKSGIPELLKSIGLNIEMKTLPVGDYIVAPETIVERKSIRDLMASIFDGRLFEQCSRLKEHFQNPIFLMEGNVDEIEEITENPLIFYGAISSVLIDFKIPVIPTPNAEHTAKLLVSMCSRQDLRKGLFLKKIKKSNNLNQQQISILCSIPGVGEKFAIRMLEKFETPLKVFSATTSELATIDGFGETRAKKMKSILNSKNKFLKKSDQKIL